ncbi:hypothetical protein OESDEN_03569 [Oesophagostomum dentatum]|uniref:Uncharacterized protein n=1 Tax=Oesophagostomum dentatum TaxID=61180 RepID=A0A0B1TK34_OESDE|nr:hypothetical protein OESDEN_03569 [Oesophagostomum dentatum]
MNQTSAKPNFEISSFNFVIFAQVLRKRQFSPLEIRILAADRRQNYLLQVIAFLIDAYQSHKQLSPNLEICNVEPEIFGELLQFQLHVPIRTIGKKSSRSSTLQEIIGKEASDYWRCLNYTTKKRYVLLLEDDALVAPEFARMMTSLMDQLDEKQHIDYVKMYHPNQLRKIPSIPLAITICIVTSYTYFAVIFRRVLVLWILVTSSIMYAELRYYGSQAITICIVTSYTYFAVIFRRVLVLWILVTSSIMYAELRYYGSQEIVSELSAETSKSARAGHAKDHILDESRFVGRQTDMNLVVHIGAVSSIRKRRIILSEVVAAKSRN